jgi:hypothetical protein
VIRREVAAVGGRKTRATQIGLSSTATGTHGSGAAAG